MSDDRHYRPRQWALVGNGEESAVGVATFTTLGRKRPSLYVQDSSGIELLATFRDDDSAALFIAWMTAAFNASRQPALEDIAK